MSKKTMLILGHTGFIGSHIKNRFKNEYNVIGYNSELDLTKRENVHKIFTYHSPDIVIHAAAVTTGAKDVIEQPWLHVTDNAAINSLVLEYCYKCEVKHTIFFSCTVMYQPKEHAQTEYEWNANEPLFGNYFGVGNMKVFTERLCEFYSRLPNAGKYTAIRHSNVFGPGDKFDLDKCHVVPAMIRKVLEADKQIEVWGSGKAKRDIIYIDDLVNFVDLCLKKQENKYELFNCGQGKAYSILEIINMLKEIVNRPELKIVYDKTKPDIPTTVILNCYKAKDILGWTPKISVHDGLKQTVDWYVQ